MSEELIERLKQRIKIRREMNGGRIDANTKDMQESIAAIEAITAERDALANRVYQLEQKNSGAAEIIAAMQETHAEDQAELKALREQEPVVFIKESELEGITGDVFIAYVCGIQKEFWRKPLYAQTVPAREMTDDDIQRLWDKHGLDDYCDADGFARAIERHLKGEGE